MATTDPRVDAYIERAAPFAQPVLKHLRAVIRAADPGSVETIKWGMPFFMHEGRMLAHMAAFKQHCGFGFVHGRGAAERGKGDEAMGQFGRITALADLPSKRELLGIVKQAVAAMDADTTAPRPLKRTTLKPAPDVPPDLAAALARHRAARQTFDGFSPSQRREYIEWLQDAKRDETRSRRLAQTLEWLAEGKSRNWKYQNC